jgi:two-component system response regulator RegA
MNDCKKILIVDDDEIFSRVLSKSLEKRGYTTFISNDISSSVEIVTKELPQYAIIDLKIKHDSGLSLINNFLSIDKNIKIVILTGYASIATAVEAIKLGAAYYLTKPTDADEIIKALNKGEGDSEISINNNIMSTYRLEWEHINKILLENNNNISRSANALGMHRRTLQRKLAKRPRSE